MKYIDILAEFEAELDRRFGDSSKDIEELPEEIFEFKEIPLKDKMLTLNQALEKYYFLYGDWQKRKEADAQSKTPDRADDLQFVLHCYNKKDSTVDSSKNIPVRWKEIFSSQDAQNMRPFGDFGQYHSPEYETMEDVYNDQIEKLLEIREDSDLTTSLFEQAQWVVNERTKAMNRKPISEKVFIESLCAIIANGSKGIIGEVITLKLLQEHYKDNKTYYVERASGEWENHGVDAMIRKYSDPEAEYPVSIKCFDGFNDNTFSYFLNVVKKKKVKAFAGIKDLHHPELHFTKAADVPNIHLNYKKKF